MNIYKYKLLRETILRNIYKDKKINPECINFWSDYIIDNIRNINGKKLLSIFI